MMMNKYEMLEAMVKNNNGYLMTSEVQKSGISRTYLSKYVSDKMMERVGTGVYLSAEYWDDALYSIQLKNKGVIFSHETALYLHGLMEREPDRITVSVRRGYNATHLIRRGIKPYYVSPYLFDAGTVNVKTGYDNLVRVYDIDRTICDIVSKKKEMDIQVFQNAIKEYMNGTEKNIHNLIAYAKEMGIEDVIRTYTEVLL